MCTYHINVEWFFLNTLYVTKNKTFSRFLNVSQVIYYRYDEENDKSYKFHI